MWFFMYTCYLMSTVTFAALLIAFTQSFFKFYIFQANHLIFMILTSILYCFTETLVIFFFVGTGVSIKEYTAEHHLDETFRKRSLSIKRTVYPPLMWNLLLMIILFVLVGAVDTHRVWAWIYQLFFVYCMIDYVKVKIIQNTCFRENTNVILEMSGLKKS